MKNWLKAIRMAPKMLFACFGITFLIGCQGPKCTSFAPLDFRLEPIPGGGARYPVVVNNSGQVLHNCRFTANLWNYDVHNPRYRSMPIGEFSGSIPEWAPGVKLPFEKRFQPGSPLHFNEYLTTVQIIGQCDEGQFRQIWERTKSGDLKPVGISSSDGQR